MLLDDPYTRFDYSSESYTVYKHGAIRAVYAVSNRSCWGMLSSVPYKILIKKTWQW